MISSTQLVMPIRVLIVDDHTLVREGTRRVLEESDGIEVIGEAGDGAEAAAKVRNLQPDVVLMDIAMPGVNGIEATRRIKSDCPSTAILILTAYDDDVYVTTLLEAGAAGYLMKDVHANDLVGAVRAVQAGEQVLSPGIIRRLVEQLSSKTKPPARPAFDAITVQERAVLVFAARGLSNKAIAREMSLSPRTVQAHLAHIFSKLDVASRTEAVVVSLKQGWLQREDIE